MELAGKAPSNFPEYEDKFGRVFVPKKGQRDEFEVLEGLEFSNTQLCLSRDKVLDHECFKGKRFSFGFWGHRLNAPIGMCSRPLVDPKTLDAALAKEIAVVRDLQLIDGEGEAASGGDVSSKYAVVCNTRMSLCWALSTSGHRVEEDDIFFAQLSPFMYLEELVEDFGSGQEANLVETTKRQKLRLPYTLNLNLSRTISEAIQLGAEEEARFESLMEDATQNVMDIVSGNECISQALESSKLDHTELYAFALALQEFAQSVRKAAISIGHANNCSSQPLQRFMAELMDARCLESSTEWHDTILEGEGSAGTLPALITLKRVPSMGILILESTLLKLGVNLGLHVRETTLFKRLLDLVAIHFQKVGDLVSFEKMKTTTKTSSWRGNEACVLHMELGMPEEQVRKNIVNDANGVLHCLEKLAALFVSAWKGTENEKEAELFVATVLDVVTSHMQWCALSRSYHDNLVLDCFLDETHN